MKPPGKARRGRLKRSKASSLLERLRDFGEDVLRFMDNPIVPFTNNQGARIFCRVRGYLSTGRKQHVSSTEAMTSLFDGKLPGFAQRFIEL